MIETRPYYVAYAGWYGHLETDRYMDDHWIEESFTFGAFVFTGHDHDHALCLLNEYQQLNYDFCGISLSFAS